MIASSAWGSFFTPFTASGSDLRRLKLSAILLWAFGSPSRRGSTGSSPTRRAAGAHNPCLPVHQFSSGPYSSRSNPIVGCSSTGDRRAGPARCRASRKSPRGMGPTIQRISMMPPRSLVNTVANVAKGPARLSHVLKRFPKRNRRRFPCIQTVRGRTLRASNLP
jgi:hypothetical protein